MRRVFVDRTFGSVVLNVDRCCRGIIAFTVGAFAMEQFIKLLLHAVGLVHRERRRLIRGRFKIPSELVQFIFGW
ncbi:hypothetical protein D3C85_1815740 [compost metagenome]